MTCAWIETSSAETGSSSMISCGFDRQRAGDPDPLALAAGELVREAVDVLRGQADAIEQAAGLGLDLAPGTPRSCSGVARIWARACAG